MYLIAKIFSYLPLWFLYIISDVLYQLIYKIGGYRQNVVRGNLNKAFPEMGESERKGIERKFYRNFCDFIVETIKGITLDEKRIKKYVEFTNLHEVERLVKQKQSVLFLASHQFNWEWMLLSAALQFPIGIDYIYHPLHHKGSDQFMLKLRGRFGAFPVKRREVGRQIIKRRKEVRGYALLADQLPSNRDKKIWVDFLNMETSFFYGIEQIAKLNKGPVAYFHIIKTKRGRYKVKMVPIEISLEEAPEGELIKAYADAIAKNIEEQPEGWLWSHKRWKRSRTE